MRGIDRLKRIISNRILEVSNRPVAENYEAASLEYGDSWRDENIPRKQWEIVSVQLENLSKDIISPEFLVFLDAIEKGFQHRPNTSPSLLEIGCSSGYYSRVLQARFGDIEYCGVDFSPQFIQFGRQMFPNVNLFVGDTTNLDFEDRSFGIVVSGSVLLHVFDWKIGIAESCRVAKDILIIHPTPVSTGKTTLFTKVAYGVKMIEWTFNEQELISEIVRQGFRLVNSKPVYSGQIIQRDPTRPTQFTYLFERV